MTFNIHLHCLTVTQNWIVKVIRNKPFRYSTKSLYEESDIYTIKDLYNLQVFKFMYKNTIFHNKLRHGVNTRALANNNLVAPFKSLSICQRHISFVGCKLYNLLPNQIKSSNSLPIFNNRLKVWYKANRNYILSRTSIDPR